MLQVICFQTMMNLKYPGNAQMIASAIIKILNMDLINPEIVYNLFGLDFEADEDIMT